MAKQISRPRASFFALTAISALLVSFAYLNMALFVTPASAAPTTMNFQGRLLDSTGTPVANGLYNMQFKLYDASSAGTLLWSETRENSGTDYRVQVTNGLFSTKLGERTALSASLFSANSVYFEITQATPATATCSTAACASWESPMTPRHHLSTSAYAFNSETLDGLDSTAFGQLAANNTWSGTNTISLTNAAALKVQNATGTAFLTVDTSAGQLLLGSYNGGTNPLAGKLVLANAANANTVILQTGATAASGYTLTLPTAAGTTGQCLSTTDNAGTLGWGACSGGGGINNGTTTQTANFNIQSAASGSIAAIIQGAASQSVDILQVKDASNNTPFTVGSAGQVTVSKQLFNVTGTTTNNRKVYIDGNVNSASAIQYGLDNQIFFQPTGAVTDIFALNNSAGVANSSQNITRLFGSITGIQTLGGPNNYTGTITNGYGLQISSPSIAGTNKIGTYLGININAVTNAADGNSGNTTGTTILNTQLNIQGNTAAADTGGTLYNTGAKIVQPSGSGAGTTHNTGLAILDSNTSVSGQWSLYNGSAQASYIGGNLLVGTTTNTNGYQLNVANLVGVDTTNSRIVLGVSNTTGTVLVLDTKTSTGDPTGVDGAMYYNLDSKSFRCYKNGLWNDCNFASLRSEWMLQEEWRNANATIASTNTMGDNNWTSASIGTGGTLTRVNVGTDASNRDRWGVMQMNSPATVNTGAHIRQEQIGMTGVPTNMTVEFDFAPVNAAAAAGLQQHARIGLHDATNNTTAPVDGIYFQYSATTAAANWFRCTRNANTETCTDTGVARTLTANQYQRFKFVTNSDGTSVEFFINESSVGSNTTNLPAAAAAYGPAINVYTVDATIRQWKTDYYQIKRNLTTLR